MLDSRCTPCYPGARHDWKRMPRRLRPWVATCRNCGLTLVAGEEEWMKEEPTPEGAVEFRREQEGSDE